MAQKIAQTAQLVEMNLRFVLVPVVVVVVVVVVVHLHIHTHAFLLSTPLTLSSHFPVLTVLLAVTYVALVSAIRINRR